MAVDRTGRIDVEAIRSNIQWELLIGQANVITDKIKALTKESDRLYKMVEDITTMSDDYNKNKDTLRYAIEGVIDISQRVSDLYNEGVEVEQSFYNLAQKQNIENDDLPDNVSNAIFNITQLAKTVENLSNRADEVSKLMPEKDTKGKILDIDNFGNEHLLENNQNISQSIDKYEPDNLASNDLIQQMHEEKSSDTSLLKEQIKSNDDQVKTNHANSEKLSSNKTSANSDQITALCNSITQLQQQIEALTTQQEQTNMQVRTQASNTLAMTMQLEQINTLLFNLSKRLTDQSSHKDAETTAQQ